jgi:hypothetical protein
VATSGHQWFQLQQDDCCILLVDVLLQGLLLGDLAVI